ncbi:MAG: hypothetical protein AAF125_10175 [Chloroflexota bacterium]
MFASAEAVRDALGIPHPRPALFISGGASAMDDNAIFKTRNLMEGGVARFAAENDVVVIDGGTNAGIMQMMGEAHEKWGDRFTLVGCAPEGKVTYPGYKPSEADNKHDPEAARTPLEPNHTHFVLVDENYWGAESDMIVGLTRAISGGKMPMAGVLINGGSIAKYDIYIASARGESPIPVLVVDGSGRSADEIAHASRTGRFTSAMVRAIVEGGKIDEVSLEGGARMMYERLKEMFKR